MKRNYTKSLILSAVTVNPNSRETVIVRDDTVFFDAHVDVCTEKQCLVGPQPQAAIKADVYCRHTNMYLSLDLR